MKFLATPMLLRYYFIFVRAACCDPASIRIRVLLLTWAFLRTGNGANDKVGGKS